MVYSGDVKKRSDIWISSKDNYITRHIFLMLFTIA